MPVQAGPQILSSQFLWIPLTEAVELIIPNDFRIHSNWRLGYSRECPLKASKREQRPPELWQLCHGT